jgi:Spy/CpxP family protein refolding chaperone
VIRILLLGIVMASVLGSPLGAQVEGPERERRRQHLEDRIRGEFLEQVARRLDLDRSQREAMVEVLREGAEARRELAREGRQLRRALISAVTDDDAPMEAFETLLVRFRELREREWALEREEQERVARILNPRQQAVFLFLRMQFNERIRGMRGPRRGPPGGPGGGGPLLPLLP